MRLLVNWPTHILRNEAANVFNVDKKMTMMYCDKCGEAYGFGCLCGSVSVTGLGIEADEEIRQLSLLVKSLDKKLAEYERIEHEARTKARGLIAPLKDAKIDSIAESMPGGLDGFLKHWGWKQFARAIEDEHGIVDA